MKRQDFPLPRSSKIVFSNRAVLSLVYSVLLVGIVPVTGAQLRPPTNTTESPTPTLAPTDASTNATTSEPSASPSSSPSSLAIPTCPIGMIDISMDIAGVWTVVCCAAGDATYVMDSATSFTFDNCTQILPVPPPAVTVSLYLRTDTKPEETSFSLLDIFTNQLLWDVFPGSQPPLQASTDYTWELSVDPASCYLFTIQDAAGDGLTTFNGVFEVFYDGNIVLLGSDFGSEATVVFGDGCD